MKKGFYLLLVLVFFLASCSEDGNRSSSVHIQLLPPEGYSTLPYEEMEVTLTNKDQGTVYSLHCSSTGQAYLVLNLVTTLLRYIIRLLPGLF